MIPFNVSFGIFAFLPQGWLFMLFVIFIEGSLLSKSLTGSWKQKKFYRVSLVTNVVSGIAGFLLSMALNGGWWLVIWIPWVSRNEVNIFTRTGLINLVIYYTLAFVLTIVIETVINLLLLKKQYNSIRIIKTTLAVNLISYLIGSIVLYSYSFS